MPSSEIAPAIPKGSLVLVTGANGFVGSHVVEQFLAKGFRVRGTACSESDLGSLNERWESKYPGRFEIAVVADIAVENALLEATQGCDGVAHVASNASFSTDLDAVVRDAVDGTLNALRAAASTPSVKRFVVTSSILAVGRPEGKKLSREAYNLESIEAAESLPAEDLLKGLAVYSSSKTQAELVAWKFMEERKPSFVLNTVLPAFALGTTLHGEPRSSAGMVTAVFLSERADYLRIFEKIEFVSVTDAALLHVGALILPDVANKRLVGSAYPRNWNSILAIFRKNFPDKKFYDDFAGAPTPSEESVYATEDALEVLKKMGKQDGWTPLEQAVLETVAPFA